MSKLNARFLGAEAMRLIVSSLSAYCGWALTQRWEGALLAFIIVGWLGDIHVKLQRRSSDDRPAKLP